MKTEEVEGSTIEVASDKLGKSINITSNDIALDISPFAPVELVGLTYSPYARAVSAGYAELVERFTCEIRGNVPDVTLPLTFIYIFKIIIYI